MKLKKLEIQGFKSFQDKAAIRFPEGISAVVGPNGCGKSNVITTDRYYGDAICILCHICT
ncbi:MAG: AAA family ATPase, partial [Desulfosarcina sp.]|nr:AAA family ATPase [Desulfobacterales bacterium]